MHKTRPSAVRDIAKKPYKITIISDRKSWIQPFVKQLQKDFQALGYKCVSRHNTRNISSADFCFYLSYEKIVGSNVLSRFRHNLVVHESDLPRGKGWSPLTWQILNGKNKIPMVIFEASAKVDSGVIYHKTSLCFKGHELVEELRNKQGLKTIELCKRFVEKYPKIVRSGKSQREEGFFYPRRYPKDSKLDIKKTLRDQFNLLRVVDNSKYPAFFRIYGKTYQLHIKKQKNNSSS